MTAARQTEAYISGLQEGLRRTPPREESRALRSPLSEDPSPGLAEAPCQAHPSPTIQPRPEIGVPRRGPRPKKAAERGRRHHLPRRTSPSCPEALQPAAAAAAAHREAGESQQCTLRERERICDATRRPYTLFKDLYRLQGPIQGSCHLRHCRRPRSRSWQSRPLPICGSSSPLGAPERIKTPRLLRPRVSQCLPVSHKGPGGTRPLLVAIDPPEGFSA